ncbi:UDP-N-acetylmuramoyl-tripeptide--D-alanyl-D-alanine ligase [Paenibacillus alginolyticus]|uniref:UDP-N-acetylmuramoyl-tripeptide--D-alanyl-D- alanine ligase n=1 Tax=Paenibacillus alginolyticus TaxID=59839 RepID=UPI0004929077|nr:UDP-N-acetylmuramoyl-tripeptide--D-alanyl-D-alanine ligase [Paenibacillus alginolyticus]MCY9669481.1 UDP-N-acetylmuramoyl-tripeptide--D-alanyl-D-alanine ligase [Paenibacillus alginolyticus]
MIERTLEQMTDMLGVECVKVFSKSAARDILIKGISTDTRTIRPGSLFVPLIGDHFDGHAYASEAYSKGAAAALWQDDHPHPPEGMPIIRVKDTLTALQQLAKSYREQLPVRIIGITGSNGKTTTKDLVAAVLGSTFQVHKTKGNLNNHIGLPLTLLELDKTTQFAVVEMGMSGRGEIELLSNLAEPEASIITMIGESHMLQLGSREEIARAKAEIVSGMSSGGLFVYNGDEPLIEQALAESPDSLPEGLSRIRFGSGAGNDLFPTDIRMDADGAHFQINSPGYPELFIPLLGTHNVINALAAIAVGEAFGVSPEGIAAGLRSLQMTSMRIEKLTAASGLTVLNDAYNASPASMRAAIDLTEQLRGFGRKFLVLGDMLELGEHEEEFHRSIGAMLSPERVDYVFTFGRLGRCIADEAVKRFPKASVRAFDDKEQLAAELAAEVRADDLVLVKGSRGMRLEHVVNALLA